MSGRKKLGNLGELFARGFLRRKGFKILFAPFRCRIGEIDLIALDKDCLVFIEVKTRNSKRYGSPFEAVNYSKQRKIIKTARAFLAMNIKIQFETCRFDVLAIDQSDESHPEITHLEAAFQDNSGV